MYSVKNIKLFEGREGCGFNATLYCDKKKVARVIDSAMGGPIDFYWFDYDKKRVECEFPNLMGKIVKMKCTPEESKLREFLKTLPKCKSSISGDMFDIDPDMYVCGLVDQYENDKRMKRLCKNKTIVHMEDSPEGEYSSFNVFFSPKVKEDFIKRYGDRIVEFVNERY